ncbi:MAG: hypothetical protein ACO1TE_27560 [Prosthecobacter sp.]
MTRLKRTGIIIAIALTALLIWRAWPGGTSTKKAPAPLAERVRTGVEKFRHSTTQAEAKLALEDLKRSLRQMDATEAGQWIVKEIMKGEDVPTHLNLTIGPDQNLTSWPSYRVFLLDMLFLVDPSGAADMARQVLVLPELTMDEVPVVMRNLARGSTNPTPEDMAALTQATTEMLRREDWLKDPSTGFLEGFDVIVHTQNTAVTPTLLQMSDDRSAPKLRQAAFLTLDRLVTARPAEVLPLLGPYAATHPNSQLMISNMVARADVRDAAQRQAVEDYLLSTSRTPEELRGFASTFPNANMAVGSNLITRQKPIPAEELMKSDRAALDVVAGWLADPRFERARPALRESYKRLSEFVRP